MSHINENEDDRIRNAADDMIKRGTSLDDAAKRNDVDRDQLSQTFGEEMNERYGRDKKKS